MFHSYVGLLEGHGSSENTASWLSYCLDIAAESGCGSDTDLRSVNQQQYPGKTISLSILSHMLHGKYFLLGLGVNVDQYSSTMEP